MINLYDHNFRQLGRQITVAQSTLHVYAHEFFSVSIARYTQPSIASKVPRLYTDQISHQDALSRVINFTLYIPENGMQVVLDISRDGQGDTISYLVTYNDGNILEADQQHYTDILYNKFLPNYDQLKDATVNSTNFDQRELVKRLLLDFKKILQNRGTKQSVENFFKYLGYEDYSDEQLVLTDVFRTPEDTLTTVPDITRDIKTGHYQMLYNYWNYIDINNRFDQYNLPDFEITIVDYDDFLKNVVRAINLANIYFTAEEQIIDAFYLVFMTNAPRYFSTLNRNYLLSNYDVLYFRHFVKTTVMSYNNLFDTLSTTYVNKNVVDYKLTQNESPFDPDPVFRVKSREIKYRINTYYQNLITKFEFYQINEELFEDTIIDQNILTEVQRGFGNILHTTIDIADYDPINNTMWVEVFFFDLNDYDLNNPSTYIYFPKNIYTGTPLTPTIAIFKNTTYRLLINTYDAYGARETWFYDFEMSDANIIIDVDIYNSNVIQDPINDILQGVTIPNNSLDPVVIDFDVLGSLPNFVLPLSEVPTDLSQYYLTSPANPLFFMHGNPTAKPVFTLANKRLITKNSTQTIPIKMLDAYLSIIQLPYHQDDQLFLKIYDPYQGFQYVPYSQVSQYSKALDTLWIQVVEIFEQQPIYSTNTPQSLGYFWMIISAIAGLDMDSKHLEFYIYTPSTDTYTKIQDINEYQIDRVSLDYDIPMTFHNSAIDGYISQVDDVLPVLQNDDSVVFFRAILSLFSHLTNIRNHPESFYLKLNDAFYAQLSERYIDFPFEVSWTVKDSFTHETLYQTSDRTLKYRYNGLQVLDIEGTFTLNNINGVRTFPFFRQSVASYLP